MKQIFINSKFAKTLFFSGLMAVSINCMAQKPSVSADLELGSITLTSETGLILNPEQVKEDETIILKINVKNANHGQVLPAGSCKIKIGFGSKLQLDPLYNLNSTALASYFRWTASEASGQLEITGDLVNALPAHITNVSVAVKAKAIKEGASTITANFLITNHNTTTVLSDENGANNVSFLKYNVAGKGGVNNAGKMELSLYPNPVKDVRFVVIKADKGQFNGQYNTILYEVSGKVVQTGTIELNGVTNFTYKFGHLAAGQYMLRITKDGDATSFLLKFAKL